MEKLVLFTEPRDTEDLVATYGGKGAGLHRMAVDLGLPVPEGFTIPCSWTFADPEFYPLLDQLVDDKVKELNDAVPGDLALGNADNPMLVSVRSGAPKSMPGMMETILNLGINDETIVGLIARTNERFAWDAYRRFVQMYAVTALGVDSAPFTEHYEGAVAFNGGPDLPIKILKLMVQQYKQIVINAGFEIPSDITEQLRGAIRAVFNSWDEPKAVSYRKIENIPHDLGTAVNVQRMVFGNLNDQSGTGVAFTRDPNTGEAVPFGDFLINAQGEDVVDGSHITMPLAAMKDTFPEQAQQLDKIMEVLEATYKDMCDIEFTIEDGKLYILQTRVGKRGATAATKIAVDMLAEGKIDAAECVARIEAAETKAKIPTTVVTQNGIHVGTGQGASPGKVWGKAVFSSLDAVAAVEANADAEVILITHETNPSDIEGMAAAVGILTAKGGLVSHAAVVARGWNKPCVVGCPELTVQGTFATIDGKTVNDGDLVCIDGVSGEVFVST